MLEPKYKLIFEEGILVPKQESLAKDIVKWLLILFFVGGSVMSLLFGENLFGQFAFSIWICIALSVGFLFKNSGHKRVGSPCELWFYDEYMIQYRPQIYYSKNNIRREFYKLYYKDIKRCLYRISSEKINLYGILEGTFYKFDKNGRLNEKPVYHKTTDGICNFYVTEEPNIDFVKIIETYTPLNVEIHNS